MKHTSKALSFVLVVMVGLVAFSCSDPAGSGTPTVSLSAQSGTITGGTVGSATFAVATAHIANGTAGGIVWYSDSAGTSSASAPTGITPTVSAVASDAATIAMTATASATAGSYYFKASFGSTTSAAATLTVSASTTPMVSLAAQSGTIRSGFDGSASFAATIANIADGTAGGISWYADLAGTAAGSIPAGITPAVTEATAHSATISMISTAPTVEGAYYFKATFGAATSSVAMLLIDKLSIGDSGPAGGLVFYDKGSYSDLWRYMEAAPYDQSTGIRLWNERKSIPGTSTAIGTGAANTAAIIRAQGAVGCAAQLCDGLTLGGRSDWFLPSKGDLNRMYENLKMKGRGNFAADWYWSSSNVDDTDIWIQIFDGGNQSKGYGLTAYHVRATRAF
jgi:hypothetical protein